MRIAGRNALASQMFAVFGSMRANPSRSKKLRAYWVKAYQPITNKPMGSGLTGDIDPDDHRYSSRIVGAVEIQRISEPGMGPVDSGAPESV